MKKLLCVCAGLLMALSAATALAADVSGTWTADSTTPNGDSFQLTFTLKQDGAKLTGTVQGSQGDAIDISNGKVDGDKISFDVLFNGMTISHAGTVNAAGDEIKMTTKTDSPDFPGMDLTLKKAK
jgi:opacity protein-like surface antigen